MSTVKLSCRTYTDCIVKLFNFTSNLFKLGCSCLQMFRNYILNCNVSACCCCRKHKCTGFDLIRNNGIFCTVKFLYTFNTDHISACTFNVSSHTIQEVGYINYVWLSCCILQNCTSRCKGCCHHNINCCTYRNNIKENMASMKFICFRNDRTMHNINIRAKCSESLQMLVDRAASNVTSTRKWYFCMFVFTKKCSQQIVGSSDLLDILIINTYISNCRSVNLYSRFINTVYLCSNTSDCFKQYIDIPYIRQILYQNRLISHYGCCKNRKCRILGTGNLHLTD